jgi:hypothetical protein
MNHTLTIRPQQSTGSVQEAFRELYPQLKLQFVQPGKAPVPAHFVHDESRLIEALYPLTGPVEINAAPYVTTAAFEKAMLEAGIYVQVFRLSGRVWLETIQTDHLSLHEQQMLSSLHASEVDERGTDEIDYD